MYLVADDTEQTIEVLQVATNRPVAKYYYESDLDYLLGLDMLLHIFEI